MFHYAAYKLAIRSAIRLPELPGGPPGRELEIRLEPGGQRIEARSIEWRELCQRACFHFPGVGRFVVRGGREVIITPDPDADETIFPLYVQGMMLASALSQRGYFVLHASVIDMGGGAIALMGPIGAGKSTLASAFHARGHWILADDNAALDLTSPAPTVLPGFPSLKVYPAVARSLGHSPLALQPMHRSQAKHAQSVADAFSPTALPLDAIYVLDREAEFGISRLSPLESITELIRHSVPTRWGVSGDGRHLKNCAGLAQRVPLFRARTFTGLHEIAGIAEEIERHFAHGRSVVSDAACCAPR
jgi:hypothetical protein